MIDEEKIRRIVNDYKLFEIDDENNFYSPKLMQYMEHYFEKSRKAKVAAEKMWENRRKKDKALLQIDKMSVLFPVRAFRTI